MLHGDGDEGVEAIVERLNERLGPLLKAAVGQSLATDIVAPLLDACDRLGDSPARNVLWTSAIVLLPEAVAAFTAELLGQTAPEVSIQVRERPAPGDGERRGDR